MSECVLRTRLDGSFASVLYEMHGMHSFVVLCSNNLYNLLTTLCVFSSLGVMGVYTGFARPFHWVYFA